jgi:hypothetical protein
MSMGVYGTFAESLEIEGRRFRADRIDPRYAARAGVEALFALDGLPSLFENDLVRASQVSDVPHTWRVKQCSSENEVTEEVLQNGLQALRKDFAELGTRVMTYLAPVGGGAFEFLAAGAIRDKLTRAYHNEQFPVVSRAIVAPKHRGKGLGTVIVEHRMKAVMRYFAKRPKAIHFGTESEKILHAVKKVEQDEGIKFVFIGVEQYASSDGTHEVHDFLAFLPWYRASLLKDCERLGAASSDVNAFSAFGAQLTKFMEAGVSAVSGRELEASFRGAAGKLVSGKLTAEERSSLAALEEVFVVKKMIGAMDPVDAEKTA